MRFHPVMNEFLTADHSFTPNDFEKTLVEVSRSHLYAAFDTFCVQIGQLLGILKLFENGQIAVFEGKCRQFRILPKA